MSVGRYHRRFPFAALYEYVRVNHRSPEPFTQRTCDQALGFSDNYTMRSLHEGRMLTVWQADRFACRLGVHPSLVWDDFFELDADRVLPRRIVA